MLTRTEAQTIVNRPDLVADECEIVGTERINWRGREAMIGAAYGRSGGSAGDRRIIVEAFAKIERELRS